MDMAIVISIYTAILLTGIAVYKMLDYLF